MNCIKQYIEYLKDNPQGYWFKRKLYGWGWIPVKWQGWLVVAVGVAIFVAGIYLGEIDDAPGAALLGLLFMITLILFFGYKKGEKPRWQWGPRNRQANTGRSTFFLGITCELMPVLKLEPISCRNFVLC